MSAVLTSPPHPLGRPIVDAAFLANPYPTYQALREAGPIHWSEEFFGGAWLLTRHADVEGVLRDPRFAAQRTGGWVNQAAAERGALAGFQQLFARSLLFLDAPDHGRLRALLQPAFRPEALARLKPRIERIADELIEDLDGAEEFDFIARLARPLPVRVISTILGIEGADRAEVMAWSDDLAAFIGAPEPTHEQARRAQASLLAMTRYFQQQIAAKRDGAALGAHAKCAERQRHAEAFANGDVHLPPDHAVAVVRLGKQALDFVLALDGDEALPGLADPARGSAFKGDDPAAA